MDWGELIAAIILGSAALIVAACKRWRFLYIIVCAVGSIGMPLGFSARIYDAATGKAAHRTLLLIVLFSIIVIIALICGRRLLPLLLYRMVFLFGCVYFIFVSAGLFDHYYLIHASVDPKTVQYLAGHQNSKITMDIYAKVKYNKADELAEAMRGAFALWDASA